MYLILLFSDLFKVNDILQIVWIILVTLPIHLLIVHSLFEIPTTLSIHFLEGSSLADSPQNLSPIEPIFHGVRSIDHVFNGGLWPHLIRQLRS